MSSKASSDFGLYRDDKEKSYKLTSVKFVVVLIAALVTSLAILYTILYLLYEDHDFEFERSIENPAKAEKLLTSSSTRREAVIDSPPKPFGVILHGHPPSEFTSTTEKITTLSYPQLNNYRHKYYPRNIQDVIGLSNHRYYKTASPSQYVERNLRNTTRSDYDRFHSYKPQDPGDVNLLATGNVRFAPPIWSNLRNQPKFPQYQLNSNRQEIYHSQMQKPLTVTLNIYPTDDGVKAETNNKRYNLNLKNYIQHRLQSKIRFPDTQIPQPKKMVIHLNLYPEMDVAESKIQKSVD